MNSLTKPQLGLSGQYRVEIKRNGIIIKETDWFDNLITNTGLDYLGSDRTVFKCKVGTGTSAPNVLDFSLSNELASVHLHIDGVYSSNTAVQVTNSLEPNFITSYTYNCVFPQGAVVGNITEVGIGPVTEGLFSRALITDSNNVPTSLTLLAIDQLTLYYKLTVAPVISVTNGSVTINSVVYNYTCQLTNPAAAFNTPLFLDRPTVFTLANFKTASLVDLGSCGHTPLNYVNGSYTKGFKINCPIDVGNHADGISIMNVYFNNNGERGIFKYTFARPIIKTNTQVLTLDLTRSWGRG